MRHTITRPSACLLIALLAMPNPAPAAELKREATQGFEQYVRLTEQRILTEVRPGGTFLWVDGLTPARRREATQRLQRGEVMIERMETRPFSGAISTPRAMIHHWVGSVLIPGVTLEQVLRTIQDYDRHQEYFSPEVVKSRTIERDGDNFRIYLRLKRTKVITAVFDTEHRVRYHNVDAAHAYSESRSTRIAEIAESGGPGEHALSSADEHGFLWRLNSYWRFSQAREGVYVQCEAVSLTRNIPTGLGWLVGPFVESVPKDSLDFTLQSTRAAVLRAPK